MKQNYISLKKFAVLFIVLALLVSLCPQSAFADTTGSLSWSRTTGTLRAGNTVTGYIKYNGVDLDNLVYKSSDEAVVSSKSISQGLKSATQVQIKFFASKAGTVTITAYDKTDESISVTSPELTFTELESSTLTCYTCDQGSVIVPAPNKSTIEYQYKIDDETVAVVDENGTVTGKTVGETTVHAISEEYGIDWEYPVVVKEDSTGIYYNGEEVTELSWDKADGDQIELSNIWYVESYISVIDLLLNRSYFCSTTNTDIAEMEYVEEITGYRDEDQTDPVIVTYPTGKINVKKNGTAVIYFYKDAAHTKLIGSLKINVTGCDETFDPEDGWQELETAQGTTYTTIQLIDDNYTVSNQTLNIAANENKIEQILKANALTFTLRIKTEASKNVSYTDEQKADWEKEILSRINICKVNEDGTIGDIVASNGNGYTLRASSYATDQEGTLKLAVEGGKLNKGSTYALVANSDVAYLDSLEYYQIGGSRTFLPIGVVTSWQFTTAPAASSVTLDQTEATLKPGEDLTLTAELDKGSKIDPDDTIVWSSSDESVATVDNDGKVTAKKVGTATITATAVGGKVSAECKVTVEPIKVTGITLDTAKATIYVGKTRTLKATVAPSDATYKAVTWTSSNSKVAKVDTNGKVTAVAAGIATITAKSSDGTVTAKAVITVKNVAVTKVKSSASKATLAVGKTKTLKATVSPSNATNKAVSWTSSNKKVAKVSSKGKVTAVAPGTATITVTTKDGKFKAKTVINVKPKSTSFTLTAKKNSVVIKYKKVSGVTGYQIYRAKSKNGTFKKITTRAQKKTGKYTSLRLSSKHTYYYKIRTYKTVNGKKIYSSFSAVKKIKTK